MLTLAVAPPAQAEIFVTVRGQRQGVIRGDSTIKGHENQIVASSFDYDVKSPRDPATGLATGKRQHSPITLRLNSGAASVHLFQALVTNENLTSVVIDFVAASDVGGLVSLKRVTLTNAALSDLHQRASSAKTTWQDDVSIVFQKIEVLDVPSGTSASDSITATATP
jgi:type VI secretion system secreted protein Hcp